MASAKSGGLIRESLVTQINGAPAKLSGVRRETLRSAASGTISAKISSLARETLIGTAYGAAAIRRRQMHFS